MKKFHIMLKGIYGCVCGSRYTKNPLNEMLFQSLLVKRCFPIFGRVAATVWGLGGRAV